MENTEVSPSKTAGEISTLLVARGAREISMQYDAQALIGLRFTLLVKDAGLVRFELPVRTEPIFKILNGRRRYHQGRFAVKDRQQAERVAWRQVLRWVQAQLAMIETGMVETHEVFLPYALHAGTGQTLFGYMESGALKQLAAPGQ